MFIVVGFGALVSIIFHIVVKEPNQRRARSRSEDTAGGNVAADDSSSSGEMTSSIEKSTIQHSQMTWKDWLKNLQFYQVSSLSYEVVVSLPYFSSLISKLFLQTCIEF